MVRNQSPAQMVKNYLVNELVSRFAIRSAFEGCSSCELTIPVLENKQLDEANEQAGTHKRMKWRIE